MTAFRPPRSTVRRTESSRSTCRSRPVPGRRVTSGSASAGSLVRSQPWSREPNSSDRAGFAGSGDLRVVAIVGRVLETHGDPSSGREAFGRLAGRGERGAAVERSSGSSIGGPGGVDGARKALVDTLRIDYDVTQCNGHHTSTQGVPFDVQAAASAARLGPQRNPAIDEAVLQATRDLLVENGYAGTSIDAIATRAGVGRPAIYRRWPSKAHIVHDAVYLGDGVGERVRTWRSPRSSGGSRTVPWRCSAVRRRGRPCRADE